MDVNRSAEFLINRPSVGEDRDVSQTALDAFGELLMKYVRDASIRHWDKVITGQFRSVSAKKAQALLKSMNAEELEVLYQLIPQIIDITIHYLLWILEQVDWLDIAVQTDAGTVPSLREVSDGLAGEAYDWKPKYSTQRYDSTLYDE